MQVEDRLSRRRLLMAAATVLSGLTSAAPACAAGRTKRPYIPYSDDSFFRSRVETAPINEERTSLFRRFMKTFPEQKFAYPRLNGVGTNKWGTAYAEGNASDPVWTLVGSVPEDVAFLTTKGFHAPEWFGSMFSGTNDSPFVCMDVASGFSVWAANATVTAPLTVSVSAAGAFFHDTNGLDKRNPRSNGSRNYRSRGAIPDAMVIRRDAVDAAMARRSGLGYVLHLFICKSDYAAAPKGACHPMVAGEKRHTGGFGAEGERIRLKPDFEVDSRVTSTVGQVIARTLQENGMYIGDNSGSSSALKMEQASKDRDPWEGLEVTQDLLQGLTWDDFEVLPMGWQ